MLRGGIRCRCDGALGGRAIAFRHSGRRGGNSIGCRRTMGGYGLLRGREFVRGAQVCEARVGFVAGEGFEVCDGLAEEVVAEGFAEEVFARHGAVGGC